jgi:hypothetical protein
MSAPQPAAGANAAPAPPPARRTRATRVRLIVAAVLLVGWLGWLSYTALTKSRAPTVSHAQAAAASVPVVAELKAGEQDRSSFLHQGPGELVELKARADKPAYVVIVRERLDPTGPPVAETIGVANLPAAAGYAGPGEYLLLLNPEPGALLDGHPAYKLVGQQRSPGADLADVGPPKIYPWSPDVRKQAAKLYPRAGQKAGE